MIDFSFSEQKIFKKMDTSGDGKLSMEEYLKAMGQIPEKEHG